MRKSYARFKPLSQVTGDASELSNNVWEALQAEGLVSEHMTFINPERKNRWGNPERLELHELIMRKSRFEKIAPDSTRLLLTSGKTVHVGLTDQNGDLHGVNLLQKRRFGKRMTGVLVKDSKDRLWFCGGPESSNTAITGDEPLRRIRGSGNPLMNVAESVRRGASFSLADASPMIGKFEIFLDDIVCVKQASPVSSLQRTALNDALLEHVGGRIEEEVAREARIADLVMRHVTDEKLSILLGDISGKSITGMMPAHDDRERRARFDHALREAAIAMMIDLREAGLLAPCPNNGPREVSPLKAWNAFLEGKLDKDQEKASLNDRMMRQRLMRAPAFALLEKIMISASVDLSSEMRGLTKDGNIPISRIPDLFASIREMTVDSFSTEDPHTLLLGHEGLRGNSDGSQYQLAGSFLKPVLAMPSASLHDAPVPLPPLEEPKYIRHLELDMPSGVLVIADWFRIKGFNEGLKALIERDDDHDLNTSAGLDARARDYFEKAGLGIVQVGNTSPDCYSGGDGIFRMGRFDEDHEDFWTENGEPSDLECPTRIFSTCTDLWANSFCDREAAISILEASGEYATRLAASEALESYVSETYGASQIDLETDTLHLYVPTGPGLHKGNFHQIFRADEIEQTEWMQDQYILSTKPLSVDPALLEDCDWVCKDFGYLRASLPEPDEMPGL